MKVACIQPSIHEEIGDCYKEVEKLLKVLVDKYGNCDIACLPERWIPFYKEIEKNFQSERGENYQFIEKIAKKYKVAILSGAIWEKRKNEKKPYITCYYFNNEGEEVGRQDKIHLYTYEKKYFTPSKTLNLFKWNEKMFSILICFDVAFYETPRLSAENGAEILFSPTQIRSDGMDNWKIYLQSRALENRIPIVACNTVGTIGNRKFVGNSQIISFIDTGQITPSKLKIVEGPLNKSGHIYSDLNIEFPRKMREIRLREKIEKQSIKITKNF
jgi:predicted amidohydrolase